MGAAGRTRFWVRKSIFLVDGGPENGPIFGPAFRRCVPFWAAEFWFLGLVGGGVLALEVGSRAAWSSLVAPLCCGLFSSGDLLGC